MALNNEECSTMPETIASDAIRFLPTPFPWEILNASEPAKNRDSEVCSTRPGVMVNEVLRDLNREVCSTEPELTVKKAPRVLVKDD